MKEEGRGNSNFCVVGIGASAGGLEALQDFSRSCQKIQGRPMW